MTKYGFDYFSKRVEVLNEMARTTTRYNGLNVGGSYDYDFVALRNKVNNSIKSGMSPHAAEPLVDEDGNTANGVIKGPQYRTLIYMFSKVYNTILDSEDFDFTSDIEFENAKNLMSMDISKLPIKADIHTIIYEIQEYIKENSIELDKTKLNDVTRKIVSNYVPNIQEVLNAHDRGDKNSGIEKLPVILVDIYRDPSRFLSSIFEIENSKTTSGKKMVDVTNSDGDDSLSEVYQKKMASLAKKIFRQYNTEPKIPRNPTEFLESATIILIKMHPELIFNKSFVDSVLDPVNIANFINKGEGGAVMDHSSSKYAAKNIEDMYKISAKLYNEILSKSRKLRTELSYAERIDARRKTDSPKSEMEPVAEKTSNGEGVFNIYTTNVDSILIALENMKYYKDKMDKLINERSDKFDDYKELLLSIHDDYPQYSLPMIISLGNLKDPTIFDSLYEGFSRLEDTGISVENFYKTMESAIKAHPKYKQLFETIVQEVNDTMAKRPQPKESISFPGFEKKHIEKVLNSPEKLSVFKSYYNIIYIPDVKRRAKEIQQTLDVKLGKEVVGKPLTAYSMRQAEKRFQQHGDRAEAMERDKIEAQRVKNKEFSKEQNKLNKGIADIIGKPIRNESYVMNYMSEQVQKDMFKPRGEFKERGFKKPTNYWQGRNL